MNQPAPPPQKAASTSKVWGWFPRLPVWGQACVAFVIGVFAAFGQAPFDNPLVMLLALIMGFVMMRRQSRPMRAAFTGWSFGFGYFALALVWILHPFQVDADRYAWMAPFALLFLSAGLALFWGLAFWAARRLSSRTWPLVLTWTAAEMLRAYVFTGFPWASPSQALINGMAGQILAWFGPHGAMLWLCATAWVLSFPALRTGRVPLRLAQSAVLISVSILILVPPRAAPSEVTGFTVRLVQPNIDQTEKWQSEKLLAFFDRHLSLTTAPPAEAGMTPDLVVWPETAIPWQLDDAAPSLAQMSVAAGTAPLVFGVLRREGLNRFNSLAVLEPGGTVSQTYDKHHIVPFGEYIPMAGILGKFGLKGLAAEDGAGYAKGPGAQVLSLGKLGLALPLICYEAVFAQDVNAAPRRVDFIVQVTNDAWFGKDAGPQQHLAQARMRAIEQGLPLMRSANTGISAMIDPRGRVTHALALGEMGFVDAPLPKPLAPTLYSRTGDGPLAVWLALVLAVAAVWSTKGTRKRN
ncbi:MAG: apolipoprotein N-acyltransferase [Sulfitobacter sp.]